MSVLAVGPTVADRKNEAETGDLYDCSPNNSHSSSFNNHSGIRRGSSSASASNSPINSLSVLCKEVFDENYQPSHEEIIEYAIKIGINPSKEPHLLSIARDGLMLALPSGWQPCYNDKTQAYYYYNALTKQSQWEHPLDAEFRALVEAERNRQKTLVGADFSDDLSQIDSGIRSLQGDSDMSGKADNNEHPIVVATGRRLAPIIDRQTNPFIDAMPQPVGTRRIGKFEVSSAQIGLDLKANNVDNGKRPDMSVAGVEKTKGFTLTGAGAMFLKSNTKKVPELHKKSSLGDLGVVSVKGILRDSSLTDIRPRGTSTGSLGSDGRESGDTEDRKSVRFNLIEKKIIIKSSDSSDGDEEGAVGGNGGTKKSLSSGDSSDDDDADDDDEDEDERHRRDEWDFETVDLNDGQHVKEVRLTPSRNDLDLVPGRTRPLPSLPRSDTTLFDTKRDQSTVRPLYETESDSESQLHNATEAFGKAQHLKDLFTNRDASATDPKELELNEKDRLRKEMEARLKTFQDQLIEEQRAQEKSIRTNIKEQSGRDGPVDSGQCAATSDHIQELEVLKASNQQELKHLIEAERCRHETELATIRKELEETHNRGVQQEKARLQAVFADKCNDLSRQHQLNLTNVVEEKRLAVDQFVRDSNAKNEQLLDEHRVSLQQTFANRRQEISEKHRTSVELLQKNHSEILHDLERDLKTEEDLLRKEHTANLKQLRDRVAHELEIERQRMRDTGEDRLYEKIRCEKRLLEDKYRCLKEKYGRLKADVKLSLERRNNRRREQHQQDDGTATTSPNNVLITTTTGSETDRSQSTKPPVGMSTPKHRSLLQSTLRDKSVDRVAGKATSKYIKHLQQQHVAAPSALHYHDDTTSISQSDTTISNNHQVTTRFRYLQHLGDNGNSDTEAIRAHRYQETATLSNNNNKELTPGRQRKKFFSRAKSASTSRLNSSNHHHRDDSVPVRPCTPVENLRRQLQKLEDLEDQFPDTTLDTTYHLRYPFTDIASGNQAATNSSSELEFFKHRIHLERDSVRRAKDSLRSQRTNFRARQREIKLRHKNTARHTVDQMIQEEKELTEMEVNLHRTRALLGEKVIRLRHLEQSLQRICDKEKPLDVPSDSLNKDEPTLSDLSSHSSSGFSSTDFASDTNHLNTRKRKEIYQESSEIVQSLEHLNAEIREIWEILSKQQAGIPPPPITTVPYTDITWPIITTTPATPITPQPTNVIPTLADRLETYRQIAATTGRATTVTTMAGVIAAPSAAHTIVSQSPLAGHYTTSLVERTRDLRNWLRQAKTEHELLASGQQQANL